MHDRLQLKVVQFCDKITEQFPSPEDPRAPIAIEGTFVGELAPDQPQGEKSRFFVPIEWYEGFYPGCQLKFPSQNGVPELKFTIPASTPVGQTVRLKVEVVADALSLTGLLLMRPIPAPAEAPTAEKGALKDKDAAKDKGAAKGKGAKDKDVAQPDKAKARPVVEKSIDKSKPVAPLLRKGLKGRVVRVPADLFPDEEKPPCGYWLAKVKCVLQKPKGHVLLETEGEEEYHRPIEEVLEWEPHA